MTLGCKISIATGLKPVRALKEESSSTPQSNPASTKGQNVGASSHSGLEKFLLDQSKIRVGHGETVFRLLSELAHLACGPFAAQACSFWLVSQDRANLACIASASAEDLIARHGIYQAGETRSLDNSSLSQLLERIEQARTLELTRPTDNGLIALLVNNGSDASLSSPVLSISSTLISGIWLRGVLIGFSLLARAGLNWSPEKTIAAGSLADLAAARIAGVKQNRSEASAKLNEFRVKRFIKNTPFAIAVFDKQMRFLIASERWRQNYDLASKRILGRSYYDICPELPQRWKDVHQAALSGTAQYCEEDTFLKADGNREWIRWDVQPWYTRAGDIGGIVILRDRITELKQEQCAREQLSSFVELNPSPVVEVDIRGNVEYMNDAAKRLFPELPLKRFSHPFLHMVGRMVHSLQAGLANSLTYQSQVGDLWFEQVLHFMSETQRVRVFSIDITERKWAENERCKLEEQIQSTQKLESLAVLAGGVAHDFNNLLMGILGNAGLILEQLPSESPHRLRIERVKTAGERAAELTNQLLAYSGRGRFVLESVQISELVQEMSSLLETVISKNSQLVREFATTVPLVEADSTQIRQLIMNLITNASEALEGREGQIVLSTGVKDVTAEFLAGALFSGTLPTGPAAFLEVSDNGIGMDQETLKRIFDPFFTTKFAGRGLGLAGVLGIVRSHGGALHVHSTPGVGTTFSAFFPPAEKQQRVKKVALPQRPFRGSGAFLIADDEEFCSAVAEEILKENGFTIIKAADGQQALELFHQHSSEIVGVLLDLTMPKMSGVEVLAEIRLTHQDVPVLLTSGYSEQDVVARMGSASFSSFIQKPYLPQVLVEKIKAALG